MSDALQRLLERLQTGWQPTPTEIPAEIEQRDLVWIGFLGLNRLLGYWKRDDGYYCEFLLRGRWYYVTKQVLWIDAQQRWALCADGVFWWLGEHDALS